MPSAKIIQRNFQHPRARAHTGPEPWNLFNENFVDRYPQNLSSAKLRRYTVLRRTLLFDCMILWSQFMYTQTINPHSLHPKEHLLMIILGTDIGSGYRGKLEGGIEESSSNRLLMLQCRSKDKAGNTLEPSWWKRCMVNPPPIWWINMVNGRWSHRESTS